MSKHTVVPLEGRGAFEDSLTTLIREGARQLIQTAVEAELNELLSHCQDRRTESGKPAVVRNGYLPEREIVTGVGAVTVKIPKVRSRDGQPVTFRSALVPPYVRKTKSLEAALPWLYLKGVSSGEMSEALEALVGPEAKGLSANTISRLKQQWGQQYQLFRQSDWSDEEFVYLWADGVYSGLRAEDAKLCALVVMGVTVRGEKKLLAVEDGVRESTQSWREVLLGLKSRGLSEPKLAVGDGALGLG